MSDTLTLTVEVVDGKLVPTPQHHAAVDAFLRGRRKPVKFTLSKKTETRSLEVNKLYWGHYVRPIALHCGYADEEVHSFLKEMFLPPKIVEIGGRTMTQRKTTTDLSPKEFSEYLLAIEAWASTELGLMLPDGVVPDVPAKARASA